MKIKFPILLGVCCFACAGLLLNSCKKSNSDKSRTELLTQQPWRVQSAYLIVAGFPIQDTIPACQLDDRLTFQTNDTLLYDNGALKCDDTDPQSGATVWSFENNETTLNATIPLLDQNADFTITTLTDTQLVLTGNITLQGEPLTIKITFVH